MLLTSAEGLSSMLGSHLESTVQTSSFIFLSPLLPSEKLRKNKYSGNMGEIRIELYLHLLPAVSCLPAARSQVTCAVSTLCQAHNFNLGIIWNLTAVSYKSLFQRAWRIVYQIIMCTFSSCTTKLVNFIWICVKQRGPRTQVPGDLKHHGVSRAHLWCPCPGLGNQAKIS